MRLFRSRGFTLVELLVVIAIIGVLVALLLPAIQAAREAARRTVCANNLAQQIMAVHQYEGSFELLPAGVTNPTGPIRNEPVGMHHGWIIRLLPYLEERNVYRLVDFSKSVYAAENERPREISLAVIVCPSAPGDHRAKSNYAGSHHNVEAPIDVSNLGVLFLNSHVRIKDISDGTSHTIFLGEKLVDAEDLGWMSGTRATLRNTGSPLNAALRLTFGQDAPAADASAAKDGDQAPPETVAPADPLLLVGGFGSAHPGGAQFAFGDGSVSFISDNIAQQVFQQLATRAGDEVIDLNEF